MGSNSLREEVNDKVHGWDRNSIDITGFSRIG